MQDKIGEEYEGIVSSVTQFGIFVELENTVEGLIRFENLVMNILFMMRREKKDLLEKELILLIKLVIRLRLGLFLLIRC